MFVQAIIAEKYRGKAVKATVSRPGFSTSMDLTKAMSRVAWEAHHSDRRPWHGRWERGSRSRKFADISVTNPPVM